MAVEKGIYKCAHCGNIVEVLFDGGTDLSCCGENMIIQQENTVDASKEKHVPVIEKTATGYKVKVGSATPRRRPSGVCASISRPLRARPKAPGKSASRAA